MLLLILILVSGTSLLLASGMSAGTGKTLVNSLGTGTMISAVVSFGQTLITSNASQKALVAPVIEESRRTLQELSAEYRSLNQEFFPTDVFEAGNEPDPGFNQLLMQDLRATKQYFFRGFSGRHAAARLLLSHTEPEVRVVIADPREATTGSGRARYLLRHEGAEADLDEIRTRLRDETWMGLAGLYAARSRCTQIEVTVVDDPPLDRMEMFDSCVWVTLYSDTEGAKALYPRTLRFAEKSYIYGMERTEFLRVCNARGGKHFHIAPDMPEEEFLGLFEKLTGARLPSAQFQELDDKFRAFLQEFSSVAELGG
nr:hypothetical protein [Amycolatopsis antarctica]